jgi:hypothetical protein
LAYYQERTYVGNVVQEIVFYCIVVRAPRGIAHRRELFYRPIVIRLMRKDFEPKFPLFALQNTCWNRRQGCQMVLFQTKNPYLGKFWRALDWKKIGHLGYFITIWYILCLFFPVLV